MFGQNCIESTKSWPSHLSVRKGLLETFEVESEMTGLRGCGHAG